MHDLNLIKYKTITKIETLIFEASKKRLNEHIFSDILDIQKHTIILSYFHLGYISFKSVKKHEVQESLTAPSICLFD